MANRHTKTCSTSPIIREMPLKTTVRCHLTPARMAIIKKTRNGMCWQRCREKRTLMHCWWECKLVQPLWKTVLKVHKKLRLELPYDPAILLLGIYSPNLKTFICKDICTSMFIAVLFTVAKTWKQKSPSIDN